MATGPFIISHLNAGSWWSCKCAKCSSIGLLHTHTSRLRRQQVLVGQHRYLTPGDTVHRGKEFNWILLGHTDVLRPQKKFVDRIRVSGVFRFCEGRGRAPNARGSRRRRHRGGGTWAGVPPPTGQGSGQDAVPLPRIFKIIFCSKWATFVQFFAFSVVKLSCLISFIYCTYLLFGYQFGE